MLGNDVVDLTLAASQSDWKRPCYLDKIFSGCEQSVILGAEDPDLMVWLLWSMKESVYKIVNRISGLRFYNPMAFACWVELAGGRARGGVQYGLADYYCLTDIDQYHLHTIAVQQPEILDKAKLAYLGHCRDYVDSFNKRYAELELSKDSLGLPVVSNRISGANYTASVSHHGSYVYVCYSEK